MKQQMVGWQWLELNHVETIFTSLQTDNHASNSSLSFSHAGCSSKPSHWVCKPAYLVPLSSQDKLGGLLQEGHLA